MSAPDESSGPYLCECLRPDGIRVPFSWHLTMKEAATQAARLCSVGCAAEARAIGDVPDPREGHTTV